jgi:hypothetical protein
MILKTTGLNPHDDHIAHYGILGMRWGRRKKRQWERNREYGNVKTQLNRSRSLYTMMTRGKGKIANKATDLYKKKFAKTIDNAYKSTRDNIAKCEMYKNAAKAVGNVAKYKSISDLQKTLMSQSATLATLKNADVAHMQNEMFRQQMLHNDLMTQVMNQQINMTYMLHNQIAFDMGHQTAIASHMMGAGMM